MTNCIWLKVRELKKTTRCSITPSSVALIHQISVWLRAFADNLEVKLLTTPETKTQNFCKNFF